MDPDDLRSEAAENHRTARRVLVTGIVGSCLSQLVPAVHAQASGDGPAAFLAVSRILTGRGVLDEQHASSLYRALAADASAFEVDVRALLGLITERNLPVDRLQRTLDRESSRLASLPRRIVTAWYTGIVGEDERARCVTFETSLMHVAVSDRLTPPSFCHSQYGSWASKPG